MKYSTYIKQRLRRNTGVLISP